MKHVFISYRRDDSAGHAGRLRDGLVARLGEGGVFMDVDDIPVGQDFLSVLEGALSQTDVLLAVIGRRWVTVEHDDGRRRLDDSDDTVRLEIERGLARSRVLVVPVLVGGAGMPRASELPSSLASFANLQGITLLDDRWSSDVTRLFEAVQASEQASYDRMLALMTDLRQERHSELEKIVENMRQQDP